MQSDVMKDQEPTRIQGGRVTSGGVTSGRVSTGRVLSDGLSRVDAIVAEAQR